MNSLIAAGLVLLAMTTLWPLFGVPVFLSTSITKGAVASANPALQGVMGYAYDLGLLVLCYVGGIVLAVRRTPGKIRVYWLPALCLIGIGIVLALGMPMSRSPEYGQKKVMIYLGYSVPCMLAPMLLIRNARVAIQVVGCVFGVGCATTVAQFAIGSSELWWGSRTSVMGSSPLSTASAIASAILCITMWWLLRCQKNASRKSLWLLTIPVMAVALVLTGSRGEALTAVGLSSLAVVVLGPARLRWSSPFAVLVAVLVWFAVTLYTPAETLQRYQRAEEGVEARLHLTQLTLSGVANSPIVGNGAGDTAFAIGGAGVETYPHSVIIEVVNEAGLLCGGVFAGVLIWSLRSGIRAARCARSGSDCQVAAACFSMLLAFFVIVSFKTGSYAGSQFLFFWTGCCYAIWQVSRTDKEWQSTTIVVTA